MRHNAGYTRRMGSQCRAIIVHTAPLLVAAICVFLCAAHDGWSGSMPGMLFLKAQSNAHPSLRLGILETDSWLENVSDGELRPATQFPVQDRWQLRWRSIWSKATKPLLLMHGATFTPGDYLAQVETLSTLHPGTYDVLLYYGGWRPTTAPLGLNLNSWSTEELRQLRALHARPFIGLETFDRIAIRLMVERLAAAGYSKKDPLFIRIAAEPANTAYGSETGLPGGKRHTARAHQAYKQRFANASEWIRQNAHRRHLNVKIVFAGDSLADFRDYAPPAYAFDFVGVDLYVTPANERQKFGLLSDVSDRWPDKALVLAELGIATTGKNAGPSWARTALAEVLRKISRHPAGCAQLTVFSVDVASRLTSRRWGWAWTPAMYQMLAEWQQTPYAWQADGFHRYDLSTYPVGRDVLYHQSGSLRVYYRRLRTTTQNGEPLFCETLFRLSHHRWIVAQRQVAWTGNKFVTIDQLPLGSIDPEAPALL